MRVLRGYNVTWSALRIEILTIYKQNYILTITILVCCAYISKDHFSNQALSKLMKIIGTIINQLKHNSQKMYDECILPTKAKYVYETTFVYNI